MVTWIRFRDKKSDREFYVVNTHFDHQIQVAREKSAVLLKERIQTLKAELPLIVLGDFNAKAGANKAYDILVEEDFLKDTWHTAKEKRGEMVATFHGYRGASAGDNRIDWILGRNIETSWTSILTCSRNNQYPSDHFPVIAEVSFK
jgi:endonuclease/exonuclease/phosphatase family metal-dependent hydrolase